MQSTGHLLVSTTVVIAVDAAVHFVPADPFIAGMALGGACIGALLPDIDANESSIRCSLGLSTRGSIGGKLLTAGMGAAGVKHRGMTHSLLATGVAMLAPALMLLFAPQYAAVGLAFAVGYFGHLLGDMMTYTGIPILWPNSQRFFLLPKRLRFSTGRIGEYVAYVVVLGILALALLLAGHRNMVIYLFRWLGLA